MNKYYIYIIRCIDNSLYTGITNNLDRRMNEHYNKLSTCAKYTKSHQMKELVCLYETKNKSLASKLEYYIKRLSKSDKELLIKNSNYFKICLNNLDKNNYVRKRIKSC